ncbi:MAG: helix-hairpin-helix domain-containing protein [Oscillospiraceae bacterium]|nr:helix-hairpin-helix domain-containing protein [Oscillospiraceae bacterium]
MLGGFAPSLMMNRGFRLLCRWALGIICAAAMGVGVVCLTVVMPSAPVTSVIWAGDGAITAHTLDTGELNLNDIDARGLIALPGIGPVIAQRIIDYRDLVGAFTDERELTRVNGIGVVRSEKLYPLVYVGE